jgi:hypothetical protein
MVLHWDNALILTPHKIRIIQRFLHIIQQNDINIRPTFTN